ncbi:MAG TPA: outer membrane beta-barrel family protein [Chitinophagaceae bacterium]
MRIFLWLFASLFSVIQLSAQQITGTIKDEVGKPLSNVTVSLKKTTDSSLVKINATNTDGHFGFNAISEGEYFLQVSHVGFIPQNSKKINLQSSAISNYDMVLSKTSENLKEVVVNSKKPIIEVMADKTVLNVEGSVNAVGQDALELLRKSPGVLVDKDENISLSGKNGVQVYIDGRPSPLSGQDLAAYLKTLQSSSIESIEIITNPSAKYDAAGNAGIINIKLKKDKTFGTNGSVNGGYSIGTFPKYNAGISLNHRNKNINIFGNYNYNQSRRENYMNLYRIQLDTLFDQRTIMTNNGESHNYKAGLDYFINKYSTIGVLINGNLSNNTFTNQSSTPISYMPDGKLYRTLTANNSSTYERNNANYNINYRYADTSGRELNMDADHGVYTIKSNQMQPNVYYDKNGDFLENRIYNFIAPTDIDIYTFKADYEQNYKKGKLGIGGKTSFVNTTNDFDRYDIFNSAKYFDSSRSNGFKYKENINALYVNYNKQFKGIMVQFGVRMENTNLEGTSNGFMWSSGKYDDYSSTFKRNYTDFFPSGAVTFNKKPENQWGFRYSRRIDRPAYQDLNPFEFKLDEYTFQKGNVNLRPQYTNSFAITNTYKYKLTSTLNFSHVKDVFTQLIDTSELSKSFITKKNLATQNVASLNVSYPFQYKAYSVFSNLNANYSHYKADLGTGRIIDLDAFAVGIYQQHTIKFAKTFTFEVSGFYNSPSIWQGTFKSIAMWGIDAGLMKTIFKGNGNIKVGVSDIFNSMQWGGTSNFAGQYLKASGGWESRLFKLNFNYRFGSNQVKAARQRKTGLEDENQRTNGGQGGIGN